MAVAARRKRPWEDYGIGYPENETLEDKLERERLERRIAEEAGPVRIFSAVEELVPEQGRRGTKGVSVRKHGLYMLTAITSQLDVRQRRMRLTMDWINKRMEITFDPKGPWLVTFHSAGTGAKNCLGKFGSKGVRDRLTAEGIDYGTYHAEVRDGGKRVVVDFTKRIG